MAAFSGVGRERVCAWDSDSIDRDLSVSTGVVAGAFTGLRVPRNVEMGNTATPIVLTQRHVMAVANASMGETVTGAGIAGTIIQATLPQMVCNVSAPGFDVTNYSLAVPINVSAISSAYASARVDIVVCAKGSATGVSAQVSSVALQQNACAQAVSAYGYYSSYPQLSIIVFAPSFFVPQAGSLGVGNAVVGEQSDVVHLTGGHNLTVVRPTQGHTSQGTGFGDRSQNVGSPIMDYTTGAIPKLTKNMVTVGQSNDVTIGAVTVSELYALGAGNAIQGEEASESGVAGGNINPVPATQGESGTLSTVTQLYNLIVVSIEG